MQGANWRERVPMYTVTSCIWIRHEKIGLNVLNVRIGVMKTVPYSIQGNIISVYFVNRLCWNMYINVGIIFRLFPKGCFKNNCGSDAIK